MAVAADLLALLVCPVDHAPVRMTAAGDGLRCEQCRRVYPIRDEIPVMLVDEARVDPA